MTPPGVALDHLVVAARTLDEGAAWCEATLGVTPAAGGRHALMGTHNRVFSIASPAFPRAYFEIIAIDPQAPPPGRARWFDLDSPSMQAALARGPQLVHWVVRCADIVARSGQLRGAGVDAGEVIAAERHTPAGLLRWRIAVRADGTRLFAGAMPTLIEWGEVHPCDTLQGSGACLESLAVAGLPDAVAAWVAVPNVAFEANGPPLTATLSTPRGRVTLQSSTL